jgi:hypothetical protein
VCNAITPLSQLGLGSSGKACPYGLGHAHGCTLPPPTARRRLMAERPPQPVNHAPAAPTARQTTGIRIDSDRPDHEHNGPVRTLLGADRHPGPAQRPLRRGCDHGGAQQGDQEQAQHDANRQPTVTSPDDHHASQHPRITSTTSTVSQGSFATQVAKLANDRRSPNRARSPRSRRRRTFRDLGPSHLRLMPSLSQFRWRFGEPVIESV